MVLLFPGFVFYVILQSSSVLFRYLLNQSLLQEKIEFFSKDFVLLCAKQKKYISSCASVFLMKDGPGCFAL